MLSNLFTSKCQRCGHRNPKDSAFCVQCGVSSAFSRPAILNGNRWTPAPDEIAVYFKTQKLQGLFTQVLHVPAGMRAWVLQDSRVEQLAEGAYTVATLFERLNNFFRSPHGEVLITRTDALPMEFTFDDIKSAELLNLTVQTTLSVSVGDEQAFRRHFMLSAGAITTGHLQSLLSPAVRQIFAEQLGSRHIEDLLKDHHLRSQMDQALLAGLKQPLLDLGLVLGGVVALTVRHDKLDMQNQLRASLWLLREEAQVSAEHDLSLHEIYDKQEWAKIKNREADLRRRYRSAELTQEEAEWVYTIRLRELDLYQKTASADTREKAIELGAQDAIDAMEHDILKSSRQREKEVLKTRYQDEDEHAQWQHVQELAKLRRDAEQNAARMRHDEEAVIERERIKNATEKMAILSELELARLTEDGEEQQALKRMGGARLFQAEAREQQLRDAQHQVAVDDVLSSGQIRRREREREQTWADAQLSARMADEQRQVRVKDSHADMDDLERLAAIDDQMDRAALERTLLLARDKQRIEDERLDNALMRDLETRKGQTEDFLARSGAELQRLTVMGTLPDQTLIALADNPEKISALLQLATDRVRANMNPEIIRASAAGAANTVTQTAVPAPAFVVSTGPSPEERTQALFRAMQDDTHQWASRMERSHESEREAMLKMAAMIKDTALGVAQAHNQPVMVMPVQASPPAPAAPVWASAPVSPVSFKACPKCHTVNVQHATYCSRCGQELP